MMFLAFFAVVAAPAILGYGVAASWELRRSRGQLPPGPGQAATTWTANGAAAPARIRLSPLAAPMRPAPTCGLTSHGRVGGTFPPERTGHPVA